ARYYEALGPIRDLVLDDSLTEVMVNGHENVYVERNGKILLTDRKFDDENHLLRVIDFIVSAVGRRIDFRTPMVDARLLDGSRVNAVISPIALDGPMLTIRKFSRDPFQAEDLVNFGTITNEAVGFLKACVMARANIIISGGTGTGKTTLLNVCSSFIPIDERIVTIEDAAELQLHQEHVCRLESRVSDVNGEGRIAIRDLVINSLRMRPDRIVVGEWNGMEGETVTRHEIFKFESKGADPQTGKILGEFNPTGIRPRIIDRLFDMGIPLPTRLAQLFPDRRQLVGALGSSNGHSH